MGDLVGFLKDFSKVFLGFFYGFAKCLGDLGQSLGPYCLGKMLGKILAGKLKPWELQTRRFWYFFGGCPYSKT